jgi:hypothetical protein
MKLFIAIGAICFLGTVAGIKLPSEAPSLAQRKVVQLVMDGGLSCDARTDGPCPPDCEDEVYLLVAVETSDGRTYQTRLPSNAVKEERGHWNFKPGNDDDSNHRRRNIHLLTMPLESEQIMGVSVFVMEEDDGSPNWAQALSDGLKKAPDPRAVAAGIGFDIIRNNFRNSDDYIGAFGVHIYNDKGTLIVNWSRIDRVVSEVENVNGKDTHEFRMNGDGSNYVTWLKVKS